MFVRQLMSADKRPRSLQQTPKFDSRSINVTWRKQAPLLKKQIPCQKSSAHDQGYCRKQRLRSPGHPCSQKPSCPNRSKHDVSGTEILIEIISAIL